jgi:hypothetical protein
VFGWFKKTNPRPSEVEERLEKVERGLRNLATDWLEFEEKVQRKVWRDAKRRPETPSDPTPEEETDPRLRHLDPVSRRIVMARRGRANGAS